MQILPEKIDEFRGDATGMLIPAHGEMLQKADAAFLTQAFRTFGALDAANEVTKISRFDICPGGSTGAKFFMTVEYARDGENLPRDLFVKFSRDFDDPRRDWQRTEMESEARFAVLSRQPGFPIRVPAALFADYAQDSGTGLIITECVPFGSEGATVDGDIEPHRRKCLDHLTMDDPLPYYRAVVTALARLAAAHKSGKLASDIDTRFPFDPVSGSADPIRYNDAELEAELQHCADFAQRAPQLLPTEVRSEAFMAMLNRDSWRIKQHEAAIQRYLVSDPRMIALCHWNAHIDNCFFWREEGEIRCGLIDWGRVGQITFGSILWGALSAAHHDIWDIHLDGLLTHFVTEYSANGGPVITLDELKMHLAMHMAAMGVARVLAFPEVIMFRQPAFAEASGPYDPMFLPVEVDGARNCRQVYVNFLQFWRREDFGAKLDALLARNRVNSPSDP